MGKGSANTRVKDREIYRDNYDDIFRRQTKDTKGDKGKTKDAGKIIDKGEI